MALHSNISPSAASRWIACPGSVALCAKLPPQKTSIHAAEGTACHSLGEKLLKKELTKKNLLEMGGSTLMIEDFEVEVTGEMIDAAILYYDTVMADYTALKEKYGTLVNLEVEKRLKCDKSIDAHVYGTCDALLYAGTDVLKLYDLKYGKGQVVEVVGNKQMTIYGIGAAVDYLPNGKRKEVELVIVQPRARHAEGPVRRWVVPQKYLEEQAVILKAAVEMTRKADAPFASGSWCRWCGGKAQCPAMFKAVQDTAAVDFAADPLPYEGALRDVRTMSVRDMAMALEWDEAISSWFDSIREMAKEMLSAGEEFPGWKLVDGKSNRKWIDEKQVAADFGALFEVYEKKLLSPAKLEKIVGKGKLDAYTFKPEASKTLAKSTDPRPATKSSAAEDFGGLLENNNADPLDGLM